MEVFGLNSTFPPTKTATHIYRKNAYFASANGFSGFRSLYGELYRSENFTRIFVIKGGPGTGKNRFMSEVADVCEAAGATGEYFYCSSDPTSLDGVILTKGDVRIALIDGTSPHARDAKIPGAIDGILDLGNFWDEGRLVRERQRILSLCEKKAELFRRAYRYLHLAGEFDSVREETVTACTDLAKLSRAAARELRLFKISPRPTNDRLYLSAFGMSGEVHLDTLQENATVISVTNPYGTARLYLRALLRILQDEGVYSYRLFLSHFSDSIPDGIYLPQNNILFLTEYQKHSERVVNMKRFLLNEKIANRRRELRLLDSERTRMLANAEDALRAVREVHFELESVYGAAMNFEEKEAFTARMARKILSFFPA